MQGYLVSANYFDVLGLNPVAGRFFLPDEDTKPNSNTVVVLSYALWTNNNYGTNGATWQRPTSTFDARLVKFGAQFDF